MTHSATYLLEALAEAAQQDNVILQAVLHYSEREQLQADIAALTEAMHNAESMQDTDTFLQN